MVAFCVREIFDLDNKKAHFISVYDFDLEISCPSQFYNIFIITNYM